MWRVSNSNKLGQTIPMDAAQSSYNSYYLNMEKGTLIFDANIRARRFSRIIVVAPSLCLLRSSQFHTWIKQCQQSVCCRCQVSRSAVMAMEIRNYLRFDSNVNKLHQTRMWMANDYGREWLGGRQKKIKANVFVHRMKRFEAYEFGRADVYVFFLLCLYTIK